MWSYSVTCNNNNQIFNEEIMAKNEIIYKFKVKIRNLEISEDTVKCFFFLS